jgi:integrase/recombinase XerC
MRKKNEVKYFTQQERVRFMEIVNEVGNIRDRVMFKLFFCTGMRISELNSLTVGKLKEGLSYEKLVITGKGNKTRTIPLVNGIKDDLQGLLCWKQGNGERMHPNAPVFCNYKGKKISNRAIQQKVKQYCIKAGIRKLSPHAFRHTVGFTMGKAGEPIQVIQKLLGHSNLNTTRIYVEPDLDQITASMSRALCNNL